jgi:hypothetical protein
MLRTADRAASDWPGRARPHSAPRPPRSLRQPSRRAPPSNRSPVPPPTGGNHQIPIDPQYVASGPRGFLVWGRGCQAPISRLAHLHSPSFLVRPGSPFLRPDPQVSNGGARRGRQDRPSLKPFQKLCRGQAASLRPRARWHPGGGRDDAVEGSSPLAARRASHHNLVFGGPRDPNHDAVLRIGRETPKWRAHSSLRHCSHRTSAGCPPPRTVIGDLLPRAPNR